MTTVILINGEAQVGKTTFANQVKDELLARGVSAESYSLVRPLFPAALAVTGRETAIDYEDFKPSPAILNLDVTGRDVMIALGNAMRGLHPYFLNTVFMNHAIDNPQVTHWFIENWGFKVEYEFFLEQVPADVFSNVVTVHLDARATRRYEHMEQFDKDNRFCLRDLAHLVNPTMPEMMHRLFGEDAGEMLTLKYTVEESLSLIEVDNDTHWNPDGTPNYGRIRTMTRRPDLSDEEIKAICDTYGLPDRESLRRLSVLGMDTEVQSSEDS